MIRQFLRARARFVPKRFGGLLALATLLTCTLQAPALAQTAASKAVVEQLIEQVVNGQDLAAADILIDQGLVQHISPAIAPGLENYKRHYAKLFKRFKEYRFDVARSLAEGDLVAVYGRLHGITKGGNKINFRVTELYRVENGKVVERWHVRQLIEG